MITIGSGEGDAIREVKIQNKVETPTFTYVKSNDTANLTSAGYYDSFGNWHNYGYTYSNNWPTIKYMYQIKCPVKTCRKMNWLELDKITPCTNCKAKLKAVSEQADYEVPVTK